MNNFVLEQGERVKQKSFVRGAPRYSSQGTRLKKDYFY